MSVDVAKASSLDDVVEAVTNATAAALHRFPARALVVRFRLRGAAGIETLLIANSGARHRALHSVASRCEGRLAIDGVWVDVEDGEVAPLRVDAETRLRIDVE